MIDSARLLAGLPATLRGSLLSTYQEIIRNYLERRWEPAELNGGKFCEAVYSIVHGAIKGAFPAIVSKPSNLLAACRALENEAPDPLRAGDRSLRVLIPRALPVLYDIRNNRGVGHIGGDVDANHMDAEAVQAMATWILAELVRIFHNVNTQEAQQAVDALVETKTPLIWDMGGVKRILVPGMSAKNQVLMFLHHKRGWMPSGDLFRWVEYSNSSVFRAKVLMPLHQDRLIEFDSAQSRARISPIGAKHVEETLLRAAKAA